MHRNTRTALPNLVPRSRRSVSSELRGGGGFDFEDRVAVVFLASLLAGERPFRPGITSRILAISWQVAGKGWALDDLLLTLGDEVPTGSLALSIKRDRQVTSKGFPQAFVHAAWQHWSGGVEDPFDRERDFLGLVTGVIRDEVLAAWHDPLGQAVVGEDSAIAKRFSPDGLGGSLLSRSLFASLQCPPELARADWCETEERVRLLRRIRLLHLDLRSDPSRPEVAGIGCCQRALESGDADEAQRLWERLRGIAAARRPKGGHLDRHELLVSLASGFELAELPDHRKDWGRLAEVSEDATRAVKGAVGDLRIERGLSDLLGRCLEPGRRTLLVGLSGCGKSALAKTAFGQWQGPRLWLDAARAEADGLVGLRQGLGVQHAFPDLLRDAPGAGLLVLDGLENWSARAITNAGALLEIVRPLGNWTVLATSRPSIARDLEELTGARFELVRVEALTDNEMQGLRRELPWLGWLWLRPGLNQLLRNLKVLDWLSIELAHGAAERAGHWASPSDVHDAVWKRWCGRGEDRFERGELLRHLAREEADAMRAAVGLSVVDPAERRILEPWRITSWSRNAGTDCTFATISEGTGRGSRC